MFNLSVALCWALHKVGAVGWTMQIMRIWVPRSYNKWEMGVPHVLSSNIHTLLCRRMCGLLGPSTPVIPPPSDLLFADIPQMLLTSSMVLTKETWAVRGMFLLRKCSFYHKTVLQKQQHERPRRPLGVQIKHLFLSQGWVPWRARRLPNGEMEDWGDLTVSLGLLTSGSSDTTSLWS